MCRGYRCEEEYLAVEFIILSQDDSVLSTVQLHVIRGKLEVCQIFFINF